MSTPTFKNRKPNRDHSELLTEADSIKGTPVKLLKCEGTTGVQNSGSIYSKITRGSLLSSGTHSLRKRFLSTDE